MKVTTDACLFGGWVANEVRSQKLKVKNVVDVGSGTGLLSLMFVQKNPLTIIDAVEIDEDAYEQADGNIAASPFTNMINVIRGDIRSFPFTKKYDVIISNPPFYEKDIKSEDQKKNIAHHHSGLLLKELISVIKKNLSHEGFFFLLLPFKRNEEIKKILLRQNLFLQKIVFVRHSINHDYFRMMIIGKLNEEGEAATMIDEISICNDRQQYTKEFKELLKDYYLYL